MARKIPQMNPGNIPSAVPRGNAGALGSGAEPLLKGFGDLADTAVNLAADAESREAEKLRAVEEMKQAIANDTAGARMASDHEERMLGRVEELKVKNAKTPEKIVGEFIKLARAEADASQKDAPNGETALDFSRQSSAYEQAERRRLHDWILTQQTQNIKDDLSVLTNRAENRAAALRSPEQLSVFLAETRQRLYSKFVNVHGKNAAEEFAKLDNRATYAFFNAKSRTDPLAAGAESQAMSGPAFDNLRATQRAELLKGAEADYKGLRNTAEFDLAKEGVMQFGDIYSAMRSNSTDVGSMILKKREADQALIEQVENDPHFKPEDRKALRAIVDTRIKTLDAMDGANRKAVGYDSEDDFALKAELMREHDALIMGKGADVEIADDRGRLDSAKAAVKDWFTGTSSGKGMLDILNHQRKLIEARNNGKLRVSTYDTLHNDLVRVLGDANAMEEANAGRWYLPAPDGRVVGNAAMNAALESDTFKGLSEDQKINARYKFVDMWTKASAQREPTKEEGRQMALQALAIVSRKQIPGAWK